MPLGQRESAEVVQLLATGALRPAHSRRLEVILLSSMGLDDREIARRTGVSRFHISRIRRRFRRGGVAGMADRPRSGRNNAIASEVIQQLLETVHTRPPGGATRWTLGGLARTFGLSRSVVHKILRAQGVAPYGRLPRPDG